MYPNGLVGLEAPEHLIEHPVILDLFLLHADGSEAVPVDILNLVLVLRILSRLLLLLSGLGLLLFLLGRLHLVLCDERFTYLDRLALPLLEISGDPLYFFFRHTEEMETCRVFQLVPEVGKEV